MLEIRDLQVTYDTTVAVDQLDLNVRESQRIALLGANGAGKTSVLNAISGLAPATGTIRFLGEDIRGLPADAIARRGLLHVPEGRHVFPTLTVDENLLTGRVARGRRGPGQYSRDDVYSLFPALQPLSNRPGWALSGGEQQMVAIGRALLGSPRLLVLDEPSLGLAPIVVDAVFAALREIDRATSLLVIEQNTSLALDFCEYAYVLRDGSVCLQGEAGELAERRELIDAYLGISAVDEELNPDQAQRPLS